jgi:nucleotide-binding universal stress UspA family protein
MPGIVVGVDGSAHSERALDWAMREAAIRSAPLTVLTVHPVSLSISGLAPLRYPVDRSEEEKAGQAAEEMVEKAGAQLGAGRPGAVTVRVVSGTVAEEIVNASHDADLLVLGSRGAGGFTRLLLGSVSSQAVHHASCPVVIVPDSQRT